MRDYTGIFTEMSVLQCHKRYSVANSTIYCTNTSIYSIMYGAMADIIICDKVDLGGLSRYYISIYHFGGKTNNRDSNIGSHFLE